MNSSSTNLVYVDAGWIALVNRRNALHTETVRITDNCFKSSVQTAKS